jgi:tetratricopeptide (TPR) repeat protein
MRFFLATSFLVLTAAPCLAQSPAALSETDRYLACLASVADNADDAFEDALTWRMEGGGWPAAHCEARALIALGDIENGARLMADQAGEETNVDDMAIRAAMFIEAGQAWLGNDQAEAADEAFAEAAALAPQSLDARLGAAQASLALGDWEMAETRASALIDRAPGLVDGWQVRAAARLEAEMLDGAARDLETALTLAPDDIDLLVLRGRINEARRLAD